MAGGRRVPASPGRCAVWCGARAPSLGRHHRMCSRLRLAARRHGVSPGAAAQVGCGRRAGRRRRRQRRTSGLGPRHDDRAGTRGPSGRSMARMRRPRRRPRRPVDLGRRARRARAGARRAVAPVAGLACRGVRQRPLGTQPWHRGHPDRARRARTRVCRLGPGRGDRSAARAHRAGPAHPGRRRRGRRAGRDDHRQPRRARRPPARPVRRNRRCPCARRQRSAPRPAARRRVSHAHPDAVALAHARAPLRRARRRRRGLAPHGCGLRRTHRMSG